MNANADQELPVRRAGELVPDDPEQAWLVRELWLSRAVGIIGGAPKCCKSWLGLDLAVSIASATACLGHFEVTARGPVLVYLAEDALPNIRTRVAGLCRHRALDLDRLDLHVITAPALRLDRDGDRDRLERTVARLKPKFLLLDPLVRLHRLDENSSGEISGLLSYFRELSRAHELAIALVHHMSKNHRPQLGQALRGSGDLHAWGDSNAYLTRKHDRLRLTLEHRAARSPPAFSLTLAGGDDGPPHLELADDDTQSAPAPLGEQVRRAIAAAPQPMTRTALRDHLRVNNERLGEALLQLERARHIQRTPAGWTLAQPS